MAEGQAVAGLGLVSQGQHRRQQLLPVAAPLQQQVVRAAAAAAAAAVAAAAPYEAAQQQPPVWVARARLWAARQLPGARRQAGQAVQLLLAAACVAHALRLCPRSHVGAERAGKLSQCLHGAPVHNTCMSLEER